MREQAKGQALENTRIERQEEEEEAAEQTKGKW